MSRTRRVVPVTLAVLTLATLAIPSAAQDTSAIRPTGIAWRPLPVLDHAGNVIPEALIQETMRPAKIRARRVIPGMILGAILFGAITTPGHDCSIYDPCTQREKFRQSYGWLTGLVAGGLLFAATAGEPIDRERAIQMIRDKRRADAGGTP